MCPVSAREYLTSCKGFTASDTTSVVVTVCHCQYFYSAVRVVSGLHHGSRYLHARALLESLIDIDSRPPTLVFVSGLWK